MNDSLEHPIHTFTENVLLPAYIEIVASPRLALRYRALVLRPNIPTGDDALDHMIRSLCAARDHGTCGPVLLIEELDRTKRANPYAGRYLATSVLWNVGGVSCAAPNVLFWMAFDRKLHAFAHRFDQNLEDQPVETITREQVLNHILNSFMYFEMCAQSRRRPW